MIKFNVDGNSVETAETNMQLLCFLHDTLDKKHVRSSCRRGLCGMCAIRIDGKLTRSCTLPLSTLDGKSVTTDQEW
jgi:aerobic-type carbon monoxide dehydrogenase small subunit (CoxS/CutS family)